MNALRLVVLWNLALSAAVVFLLFYPGKQPYTPAYANKIGYGSYGNTIIHGPHLPTVAGSKVSSTIHGGGAITHVEYSDAKIDEAMEPGRASVAQQVSRNGANLHVTYKKTHSELDDDVYGIGISLIANAEESDSQTNGAKINLSDARGGYITLGFSNDHRPFLKAVVDNRERVWWLLEGID